MAARAKEVVEEPFDEVWAKLQTENAIPPLQFKGITLREPSKNQVDKWRSATSVEEGERALFGDNYDAIHAIFGDEPEHVWENFNIMYLKHMFGTAGDEDLKD